ncbi:hypothetical protein AB8B21_31405 [Tardiphaga sp. 866_E4_N2_1]|uniref:hypothetical protein n=1 Tax=unclassified Tardiphaga TaxID=2631404 RepID=UPI003F28971B
MIKANIHKIVEQLDETLWYVNGRGHLGRELVVVTGMTSAVNPFAGRSETVFSKRYPQMVHVSGASHIIQ